ncbi:hypothetical protein AD929_15805 [Gluconobacter potus]|uniref:Uncharacterized protein n=2 Tax=Gluconobacter potus TaxID=2724927 RepID=A0A149QQ59_9PROT|nr:hypothetical protein AD929_15805 [Gluconobacter potus]
MPSAETISSEMQMIVQTAASPFMPGDTVGRQIERAARVLGITAGQCKRFWYREHRAILAVEADRLRHWHALWQDKRIQQMDHEITLMKAQRGKLEAWKNV